MSSNYQSGYVDFSTDWQNNIGGYTVDMVFCIDATSSMEDLTGKQQKIINIVKQNALNFYDDFKRRMEEAKMPLAQLRVRVITFRDYIADGPNAMKETDFFILPHQTKEFEECINGIHADGGGDIPEDGLEALAYAMKSKWTTQGTKKRQVIVVWTDAGTHELGYGKSSPYYPKGMPANLSELEELWDEMDCRAKRLVLFTPDSNYWNYILDNFELTWHIPIASALSDYQCGYDTGLNFVFGAIRGL